MTLRPKADHGLLIREVSRSHTTITTVGRTLSGQVINSSQTPLPANIQHLQEISIHAVDGIRTHNSSKRAAADRVASGMGVHKIKWKENEQKHGPNSN